MNLPASGRLVVLRGMSHVTLRAKAGLDSLLVPTLRGKKGTTIETEGHTVRVHFSHGWPWQKSSADFTLSADVPWDIEIRGGMSDIRGELESLRLSSFTIAGGVSDIELSLGRPVGACPLRLDGGASHFVIRRPKDVGVRLAIRGGASHVALDDSFFGAVGGKLRMESIGYAESTDRYDVEIAGGVSHLRIS